MSALYQVKMWYELRSSSIPWWVTTAHFLGHRLQLKFLLSVLPTIPKMHIRFYVSPRACICFSPVVQHTKPSKPQINYIFLVSNTVSHQNEQYISWDYTVTVTRSSSMLYLTEFRRTTSSRNKFQVLPNYFKRKFECKTKIFIIPKKLQNNQNHFKYCYSIYCIFY